MTTGEPVRSIADEDIPARAAGEHSGPISVGFVCSEYPAFQAQHGGIGSFVQTFAQALVARGHRATVYGLGERETEAADAGVALVLVKRGGPWASMRAVQARMRRDLLGGAIDLAESAESEAHCLPPRLGTIVRFHGGHHFWRATVRTPTRYRRLILEQLGIRRARALCAVSRFAADVTRDVMHLGRRPIEVLSNPVDTDGFVPRPQSVVPGRIVFVGSITEKKGVQELCSSMAHVLNRHPGAELQLVGRDVRRPNEARSLREEIERSLPPGVKTRVRFLGPMPRNEVSRVMASAHVCVFPSHMETQGIVIVEAMACGRPVIVTRRGPGPEVLGPDGECGFLVEPSDPGDIAAKICRVLDEPERAGSLGQRGRQRATSLFSVGATLDRNIDFYRRQIGRPRRCEALTPDSARLRAGTSAGAR